MNDDDFLTKLNEPPRQEFADQLYRRITEPMATPTQPSRRLAARRLAFAAALLALFFVASMALSPAARAFAGDILRQVGVITVAPMPQASPHSGDVALAPAPQPTAAPPQPGLAESASSADEAARLAGFTFAAPATLPAGYEQDGGWSVMPQGAGVVVASSYRSGDHFLFFNAYRYGAGDQYEQTLGPAEAAREVDVRGTAGLWITGRPMAHPDQPTGDPALLPTSWLMWEEDGINYTVWGDDLTLEEALAIAAGLSG
jgi:hypothetical protein